MGFTEVDLQNMQARVERGRKTPVAADAETDESKLHDKIIKYCREHHWIFFRGRALAPGDEDARGAGLHHPCRPWPRVLRGV